MNTTYNYVDVRWKDTRPSIFFYGRLQGYLVTLQNMDNRSGEDTLIFTSCHSQGINITNLEENTTYCVYVAAFTEYGKGNSTSCMMVATGEKRTQVWNFIQFSYKLDTMEHNRITKRFIMTRANKAFSEISLILQKENNSPLIITETLNVAIES